MAGLIRRSDIDEVRSRTNIADIIGDYVTLKGAGVGSMKGLCPFHDERSPSFHVRPQVGFYHCFGCGEGGDVYTFLQKMDHVTFQEAVERLAARIGYELHYEDGGSAGDHGNRARLLAANRAAEQFFQAQLASPGAEPGRRFLGERGFDQSAAERFGIGFAPKSYDALSKHLKAQGFTDDELVSAGLVGRGDRGLYDRFRGRLIWPIRDTTGQTLGFGARRLLDDDQGPKYLNTPETAVYHKSQVLYGLDLAKRDIARGKQVVVVEGYTDVMACHLAGVTTAVATCGTSFGVDHIKIIRRVLGDYDNADSRQLGEVVFTFDPDEAGQKAASRAFAEEQRFAAQTFVAVAPDGLDPCDLRLQRGEDAVRRLIQQRRPMFEFMVRRVLGGFDLETVEGRVAALRAAAPVVAGIRDQALGIGYVRNLAGWLGMDPSEVQRAVSAARSAGERTAASGDRKTGDGTRGERGERGSGRGDGTRVDGPRGEGQRRFDSRRPEGVPTATGARRGPGDAPLASGPRSDASRPGGRRPGESVQPDWPDAPPPDPYDEPGYPGAEVAEPAASLTTLPTDPNTRLERDALMAMLQHPAEVGADLLGRAAHVAFANHSLAVVRDAIAATLDLVDRSDWLMRVSDEVPTRFATLVQQLGVAPLPGRPEQLANYCRSVVTDLVARDLLRRKAELLGALQRASADDARYRELQQQLVQVEADRRALREET
ncbi:DNA primase [Diaminobutyricimonas aerilata]|uniref:DNA primase n=1 Tax=Diaminobutyricimonas aerilata TaxID=1162967 RepID=A0A2M9CJH8_9MICO|nr:DNA primase [Diaminobutyricimonas aerilata]PJJ72050.1 DNA primase [Diaminobutyricimonas aerilata]